MSQKERMINTDFYDDGNSEKTNHQPQQEEAEIYELRYKETTNWNGEKKPFISEEEYEKNKEAFHKIKDFVVNFNTGKDDGVISSPNSILAIGITSKKSQAGDQAGQQEHGIMAFANGTVDTISFAVLRAMEEDEHIAFAIQQAVRVFNAKKSQTSSTQSLEELLKSELSELFR
jgi:hypothetical protein